MYLGINVDFPLNIKLGFNKHLLSFSKYALFKFILLNSFSLILLTLFISFSFVNFAACS